MIPSRPKVAVFLSPVADASGRLAEEEAISVMKEHLQAKPVPIPGFPPQVACFGYIGGASATWSGKYDNEAHRWDVTATKISSSTISIYHWSVYERTKSIVVTDNDRLC